jgi:hypothetical protein
MTTDTATLTTTAATNGLEVDLTRLDRGLGPDLVHLQGYRGQTPDVPAD